MNGLAVPLFLATAIVAALAAANAAKEFRSKPFSLLVMGGYALVYGIAPLALFDDSDTEVLKSSVASLLGIIGLVAGIGFARKQFGPPEEVRAGLPRGAARVRVAIFMAVVGAMGCVMFAYGSAGSVVRYLSSGRFEFRLDPAYPILSILGLYLIPFLCVAPLLMICSQKRVERLTGIGLGLMVAIFLFFFLKGTRSLPVGLFVGLGVMLAITTGVTKDRVKGGMKASTAVSLGLLALMVVTILPNLYEARKDLSSGTVTPWSALSGGTASSNATSGTGILQREPLNYSIFLNRVVSVYPQKNDFLWLYPLRRILFFPLPSGSLKPPDTNKEVGRALGDTGNETTIPPSLPGEGYVVLGGLWGVMPWLFLYGLLIGAIESRQSRPSLALALMAVGFSSSLLTLRGQLYELTLSVVFAMLVSALVLKVCAGGGPRARSYEVRRVKGAGE